MKGLGYKAAALQVLSICASALFCHKHVLLTLVILNTDVPKVPSYIKEYSL